VFTDTEWSVNRIVHMGPGRWGLTLSLATGTIPELCHGTNEQHVWLGFGNWHLTQVALGVANELPDLTDDEYAALQHSFDFGSGGPSRRAEHPQVAHSLVVPTGFEPVSPP
jgi:hypothetical protein